MKTTRPPFYTFPILKNDQIILREIQDSDLQHLIEISYYDGIPAKDTSDARIMNERIKQDYLESHTIHWVIAAVANGEILGTCGFYRGFEEDTGEIGYVLKKEHQGHGYMAEAVSLMLDFGWKQLELKAIVGVTAPSNQPSKNILLKSGFKLLETMRDEIKFQILRPGKD